MSVRQSIINTAKTNGSVLFSKEMIHEHFKTETIIAQEYARHFPKSNPIFKAICFVTGMSKMTSKNAFLYKFNQLLLPIKIGVTIHDENTYMVVYYE